VGNHSSSLTEHLFLVVQGPACYSASLALVQTLPVPLWEQSLQVLMDGFLPWLLREG
jgi:hypothetical protein